MSSASPLIRTAALAVICTVLVACSGSPDPTTASSRSRRTSASTTIAASPPKSAPTTVADCCASTAAPPSTEAAPVRDRCDAGSWPLRRQAALMVFAEVSGRSEVATTTRAGVGGVFIGSGDVDLLASTAFGSAIEKASPRPFVATDEEGGRVQRLSSLIGPLPSARRMHATMTPGQITETAQRHGTAMRRLGVTMDFAPDADVSDEPDGAVIGDRSFSNDPEATTTDAVAFAKGLLAAGVTPVFKHFPGHGHGSGDSHTGLVTTPPLSALRNSDLVPYATGLKRVPGTAVMVGHLIVPGLTNGAPASVSPSAITDLLRTQIGFDGLVITDDLGVMRGILDKFSSPTAAAIQAAAAGADMVLVPAAATHGVVDGIIDAIGSGSIDRAQVTASANRILHALPGGRCS